MDVRLAVMIVRLSFPAAAPLSKSPLSIEEFGALNSHCILTIEDDPAIRRGIVDSLKATGYVVWQAERADQGVEMALQRQCDLVLLDLVLPGGDGLDVLAKVRCEKPTLPVIILTARGEENDRVGGLRLGADDYVVKPFSVDELLARVEAVLRRSPARARAFPSLNLPAGAIDWTTREVRSRDGSVQVLSEREASLLDYLARHPGRPIDRDELLRGVWQIDSRGVTTRTVDMHVARLREKLAAAGACEVIKTVRGQGYLIDPGLIADAQPRSDSPGRGQR
ncbi:MAG: response regulator transcription factor [Pirellulales bacterium]|nr:response regulator transcription factor [Pirellulales bacterium]